MTTDSVVLHARVDAKLKAKAQKILKQMGYTLTDAVTAFLAQVVNDRAMPFQSRTPNAASRQAIKESNDIASGKKKTRYYATAEDMINDILK